MNKSNIFPHIEIVKERFCGHIISSYVRPATTQEIRTAENLFREGYCPHNIVYDEPSWLYDFRTCYTCGRGLGVI